MSDGSMDGDPWSINCFIGYLNKTKRVSGLAIAVACFLLGSFFNSGKSSGSVPRKAAAKEIDTASSSTPKNNFSLGEPYAVNVGLNSKEIRGIHVTAFDDCNPPLRQGDLVWLTNETDDFATTVKLIVDRVIPRNDNNSAGSLFVSSEAARRLGLFKNKKPGIARVTLRKIEKADSKADSDRQVSSGHLESGYPLPLQVMGLK